MKNYDLHLFLVDDDQEDRTLFTDALGELEIDAKVSTFSNGVDLMANLLDHSTELPDIIFLDLNMPLMNGEECLEDIGAELRFSKIPVIIYSGFHDGHKINLLQEKGASHYLQKPKSFEGLKESVERCIDSLEYGKDPTREFVIQ